MSYKVNSELHQIRSTKIWPVLSPFFVSCGCSR